MGGAYVKGKVQLSTAWSSTELPGRQRENIWGSARCSPAAHVFITSWVPRTRRVCKESLHRDSSCCGLLLAGYAFKRFPGLLCGTGVFSHFSAEPEEGINGFLPLRLDVEGAPSGDIKQAPQISWAPQSWNPRPPKAPKVHFSATAILPNDWPLCSTCANPLEDLTC